MMATPSTSSAQAEFEITATRLASRGIEIEWGDGHRSYFHHIWLRDNCPCDDCVVSSGERLMLAASISPDLVPSEVGLRRGRELEIVWASDGHRTRLDARWLRTHCYSPTERAKRRHQPKLWGAELVDALPAFDYDTLRSDDAVLLQWAEAVRDVRVALLCGAPNVSGELERFVSQIGSLE